MKISGAAPLINLYQKNVMVVEITNRETKQYLLYVELNQETGQQK